MTFRSQLRAPKLAGRLDAGGPGGLERSLFKSYLSSMPVASITQAKNNLSALIDGLRNGSGVLIVDRGRPVARLEAVELRDDSDGRLARLARAGLVRLPRKAVRRLPLEGPPPALPKGFSVLEALLEERREGR